MNLNVYRGQRQHVRDDNTNTRVRDDQMAYHIGKRNKDRDEGKGERTYRKTGQIGWLPLVLIALPLVLTARLPLVLTACPLS